MKTHRFGLCQGVCCDVILYSFCLLLGSITYALTIIYKLESQNENIISHIIETQIHVTAKILSFFFCHIRYELAQQLHPQSTEDPLGGGTVAHDIQVEIEGDSLPQPSAASAEQQSMLGLGQTEVVNGSQQVTLEAPLTDQSLVQGEGKQGCGT